VEQEVEREEVHKKEEEEEEEASYEILRVDGLPARELV
jgi:hypothetical protein